MTIAWGTDSNLDDSLFYNRKEDLKFLEDVLDSSQYGSTPTILLTGVRGVGKTALINKIKNDFKDDYLVIYMDLSLSDKYQKCELHVMYRSNETLDYTTNNDPYALWTERIYTLFNEWFLSKGIVDLSSKK